MAVKEPRAYNEAFRLLGSHPRLTRPVEQVFGEQIYMHQYKINAEAAFAGDLWQWHQDCRTWLPIKPVPDSTLSAIPAMWAKRRA